MCFITVTTHSQLFIFECISLVVMLSVNYTELHCFIISSLPRSRIHTALPDASVLH